MHVIRQSGPGRCSHRCPKVFVLAPLAVLSCGFLISQLPVNTFVFFGVWYAIGMVVFFGYSKNNTVLVEKAVAELRA